MSGPRRSYGDGAGRGRAKRLQRPTTTAWCKATCTAVTILILAACGMSASQGRAAAAKARAQVTPAAAVLYQRLVAISARSVAPLDGSYVSCATSGSMLHYSLTLALYPFSSKTTLDAYTRRLTGIMTAAGWTLRRISPASLPSRGPFFNPAGLTPGTRVYLIKKRSASTILVGGLFTFPEPGHQVGGSVTINSACFDAGPAAASLSSQRPDDAPLPAASPGSS
jgi:hypothetical protein